MSDVARDSGGGLPLGPGVRVTAREGPLYALDKPGGVRSHPNDPATIDPQALLLAPYDLERECYMTDVGEVHLLNRLDGPTSGLILVAADGAVAQAVRALFAAHKVRKTYHALVFGRAPRGTQMWRDRLRVVRRGGAVRGEAGAGDMAAARVRALGEGGAAGLPLSLIELQPETGRTHQLRVQCAQRSLPIVGDATYGDFKANRRAARVLGIKRLCLHAAALALEVEIGGRTRQFQARSPTPPEFTSALGKG
jgi:23S rRNA pseudouridine955/2504/2580 synthase